jgi:hypothetical protein
MWDSLIQWVLGFLTNLATSNPIVHAIVVVVATLVLAGQAIVTVTPTTADDAFWAKIQALPIVGQFIVWLTKWAPFHKD